MSGLKCREVEDRFDDFIEGEMSEAERISVEMHLGTCLECRESLVLWKGFIYSARNEDPEPLSPMPERRLAIAAVNEREPYPKTVNWRRWALVSCGAAATAVIALVLVVQGAGAPAASKLETVAIEPPGEKQLVATRRDGRRVIPVSPGTNLWLDTNAEVRVVTMQRGMSRFSLTSGRVVAEVKAPVPGYRFIVVTPSGEVEAKGTVFSVEVTHEGEERARVIRGVVEVRKTPKAGEVSASPLTLRAGDEGTVGSDAPVRSEKTALQMDACLLSGCDDISHVDIACLSGEAGATKQPEVVQSVEPETIRDIEPEIGPGTVESQLKKKGSNSGSVKVKGEPEANLEETERLDTLVSLALARRKAGKYSFAAETYRELIAQYPRSEAAKNALVSLGQLELVELGRPRKALTYFEKYLSRAPKGFLAEEARLGQVRACDRLGKYNDVERAASDYLKTHPGGYAGAEVLRRRGDAKQKRGDCLGAMVDYHELKTRWPSSRQNARAAKGIAACNQ